MNYYLDDVFCNKLTKRDSHTTYFGTIPSIETIIRLIAAYANIEGGCILWGVEDDPDMQILGLSDDLLIKERIFEICKRLPDTVHYCFNKFNYNGKQLIGILVYKAQKAVFIDKVKYVMQANKPIKELPKIFISHSSADAKYGGALTELLELIGINARNIIFTSIDRFGIPLGRNVFDYLKDEIHENTHMIYLLSEHYFDSPASLNEMGASWMVGNDFTFIGIPGFRFGNPKFSGIALDNYRIGFTLDNKDRMIEFRNLISQKFNLAPLEERRWNSLWDSYLEKLK